jgi:hypothetical protein
VKRDICGQRFGKWFVTRLDADDAHHPKYLCICDCGEIRSVDKHHLTGGRTTNCGCANRRGVPLPLVKPRRLHGRAHGGDRTYRIWAGMRTRCNNPNATGYEYWGGKGVTVCERWDDFELFLRDMGECPPGKSIDRKDTLGNYEPGNCRWATSEEQARNMRSNKITHVPDSELFALRLSGFSVANIANIYGVSVGTIYKRLRGAHP